MLRRGKKAATERTRRLVSVSSGGLGREIRAALGLASVPVVVQPFMGFGTRLAPSTIAGATLDPCTRRKGSSITRDLERPP
jgi:hypothetical protein